MSEALQIALQTLLKTLPELVDVPQGERVTRADPRVLDSGVDHAAIIWPGEFASGDAAGCTITRTWSIPFDLFIRYTNDADTNQGFTALRDDLINLLDSYPTLNGMENVTLDRLSSDGPLAEVKDKQGGGPYFLMQSFQLEITERVALSGGEYV